MEVNDVSSSRRSVREQNRSRQLPTSSSAPLVSPVTAHSDLERGASTNQRGMPTSISAADFKRKRSLIRPERSRINRDHPTYYYTQHAAQQNMPVLPSTTGNNPTIYDPEDAGEGSSSAGVALVPLSSRTGGRGRARNSAGESVSRAEENMFAPEAEDDYYDEDEDETDKGSPSSKSGAVHAVSSESPSASPAPSPQMSKDDTVAVKSALSPPKRPYNPNAEKYRPPSLWQVYCSLVTFWAPSKVLSWCGMPTKARQSAWREKMGLISFILIIAAFVGFLTFGFTETVCSAPALRLRINSVNSGYLIIQGRAYDLTHSAHPAAAGISSGSNVLYSPPFDAGGQDGSFLFQNVNSDCKGLFLPTENSSIPHDSDGNMAWYFPCKTFNQDGSSEPNYTWPYYTGYACHTSTPAREAYYGLKITGEVYFTWDDVRNSSRNLVVYNGYVLDMNLLNWLDPNDVRLSTNRFNELLDATAANEIRGTDITRLMTSSSDRKIAKCLTQTIKVGSVDTDTIGCIASDVVLYVSLVFIVVIVMAKFLLALVFAWFLSWRVGVKYSKNEKKRIAEIEDWTDDIYRPAPHIVNAHNNGAGNRASRFFPRTSRFTSPYTNNERSRSRQRFPTTMASQSQSSTSHLIVPGSIYAHSRNDSASNFYSSGASAYGFPAGNSSPAAAAMPYSTSTTSLNMYPNTRGREGAPADNESARLSTVLAQDDDAIANYYHDNIVPQPPADYKPFNFPLVHTMCLVTAYSESIEGLRTTLDSIATTDYPNSHKLIIVVCDGLIRGAGNDMTTPEIVLSMMTDFSAPIENAQPYSYVAVASGSKRHNMAKVYSGFYSYDSETIDPTKQQRVPMLCVVKCGTSSEAGLAKPGNRGKRDSQIILMSFFQKVMFDERMTELEYEIFSGIWRITGISPDMYEIVLMVDADTKVYPDSLTKMISCMVHDPNVMGLCGETKIANKRQSWVTMIQVFEYYVSHHLTKSFESVFGGVTCLPGCFCMYRIKAPKGEDGYWVPILANPDIVERYSDNVVDTLHKKNLLLLGEDRYLSTLMLKTFPKRKQIFVPQAVCKTQVPDTFRVLLSQRRRWINSTVHNLMELTLVNSLCGVFCASMQFVVTVELVGTLVLPVALAFTVYVIVIAIVRKPVPIIPLVLLALVLGLPGVLIIVTAHRWSYVLWMMIYLLALPVWNFILPLNAYWKFDDFSWGETRQVQGGDKGHDEAEGEFDSSQIKMRRWRDFEREKRPAQQGAFLRAQSPNIWPVEN
ncbi:chitin synthase-domain-containing protein [Lipomyces doorenjongii]